jgi:hypothetical protein
VSAGYITQHLFAHFLRENFLRALDRKPGLFFPSVRCHSYLLNNVSRPRKLLNIVNHGRPFHFFVEQKKAKLVKK